MGSVTCGTCTNMGDSAANALGGEYLHSHNADFSMRYQIMIVMIVRTFIKNENW